MLGLVCAGGMHPAKASARWHGSPGFAVDLLQPGHILVVSRLTRLQRRLSTLGISRHDGTWGRRLAMPALRLKCLGVNPDVQSRAC